MTDHGNSRFPGPDEYIPIPAEHYAALGEVADSCADLEFENHLEPDESAASTWGLCYRANDLHSSAPKGCARLGWGCPRFC